MADALPPRVDAPLDLSLREYWLLRAAQHTSDSYLGVGMSKFPEDLRVYEHLLFGSRPQAVVELGTHSGGSALWFRDRLRALASYGLVSRPLVISIDLDVSRARSEISKVDPSFESTIALVPSDIRNPELPALVDSLLDGRTGCLVVEDSAHDYDTTYAALESFSRFVAPGGFYVVEDGCVDIEELRLEVTWPRGVLPALADWLRAERGRDFVVRRDLELYGISCHPSGFLQRRR